MAVPQQAVPLDVWAKFSNNELIKAATWSLYEANNVIGDFPVTTDPTRKHEFMRWIDSLPGVNWVPYNTDPVLTYGAPTAWEEQMYPVRNRFKIDYLYKKDKNNYQDPLMSQWDAWQRALAYDVNFKFLYNDHTTGDKNAPVGLAARLADSVYQCPTDLLINGNGLDMSPSGLTTANTSQFGALVQQAFDALGSFDGSDCCIYLSAQTRRQWDRGTRLMGAGGGFEMTTDAYDRRVKMFENAKIRYLGRKADQTTEIITVTENADGTAGTSNYTSVYVVRYGEKYLSGWQPDALQPINLGRDPITGATYNVVALWGLGFNQANTRSFARIYNVKGS